ncbi:helix-turn-helix domain-containing protein [Streptomyces sp. L7]
MTDGTPRQVLGFPRARREAQRRRNAPPCWRPAASCSSRGYRATTVRAVAGRASVSQETVYKSFGGKPGMVSPSQVSSLFRSSGNTEPVLPLPKHSSTESKSLPSIHPPGTGHTKALSSHTPPLLSLFPLWKYPQSMVLLPSSLLLY